MLMILDYNKTIAYRCGECGRSLVTDISIFSISNHQTLSLSCECYNNCVKIKALKDKYAIQISCSICSENHTFKLGHFALWGKPLTELYCSATSLPILFIGNTQNVVSRLEVADKEFEDLIEEIECLDIEPTDDEIIMIQVIDRIHEISDNGNLKCQYGNDDISFSMEHGCVFLVCKNCGTTETLFAETQKDLNSLLCKHSILLKTSKKRANTSTKKINLPE